MKEILTKDEKKEFEKYINFMLQNGFKKEEFEFTKMPNQNPCILKVRVRDFSKNFNIENGILEGMVLGQTYMLKDLGLDVNEGILSDKEKEYLSAVIKPFRDKVKHISKNKDIERLLPHERIIIEFYFGEYTILPDFDEGTMYAGMKEGREYTLEELGL